MSTQEKSQTGTAFAWIGILAVLLLAAGYSLGTSDSSPCPPSPYIQEDVLSHIQNGGSLVAYTAAGDTITVYEWMPGYGWAE